MEWPWNKSIARIYVNEIRTDLDELIVPIFTPDTALDVGDFGYFEKGRFIKRGNVTDRGLAVDVVESDHAGFHFASSGKVTVGPSVKVPNPAGGELLKANLKFSKGHAVVASFPKGVDRTVRDADLFGEQLAELWANKKLPTDRAVLWSIRRATGGTVIVSEEGNNDVDLVADSALLGPAGITLGGLSAGVSFGTESKATWKQSDPTVDLVLWVRLFKLDERSKQAVDAFAFEPGSPELAAHIASIKPVEMSADDELLAQLGE